MNPNYSTIKTPDAPKKSEAIKKATALKPPIDVAKELAVTLASTYAIYLKTQNYHWNVTGPLFGTLHRVFDEQYHELAESIDKIAERIRALGAFAPATFKQLEDLSYIDEDHDIPAAAESMIQNLAADHEKIAKHVLDSIAVCNNKNDPASADLLVKRIRSHEKYAWMLRSFLKNELTTRTSH